MLDDHRSRKPPPGIQHQVLEQSKFFRRKLNPLTCALDFALNSIKFEVFYREHRSRRKMAAAQQRPDSG